MTYTSTPAETLAFGFRLPSSTDFIRTGDDDITHNARTAAGLGAAALTQATQAKDSSGAASAAIGDAGITTTTATDQNLNSAAMPAGWRAMSTASTFSTGTDAGKGFARSTAAAAGTTSADYHGIMTVARPPIAPGAATSGYLVAQARASTATNARIYIQWLQGTTSLGFQGNTTTLPIGTTWTTLSIPVTFPAGVDNYRPTLVSLGPYAAGDQFDVRAVGIITSDLGYFDGDTTDTTSPSEDRDHAWDGTPGESTSTRVVTTTTAGALGGRTIIETLVEHEQALLTGDTTPRNTVELPAAFPGLRRLTEPAIYRDGTRLVSDVEALLVADARPAGPTQHVAATGTPEASGTSPGSATTLAVARARLAVTGGTILFAPGEYRAPAATVPGGITAHIAYVGAGPGVRLTGWAPTPVWTSAGGNVYATTSVPGAVSVGDPRIEHALDGVLNMYPKQAGTSAAAVTAPGQWATDGTTVWAWALGSTDLTVSPDTLRVGTTTNVGVMHSGGTAWIEGITVEGHGPVTGVMVTGGLLVMRDATAQGGAANGVAVRNADAVIIRSGAHANGQDGFNYHESGGTCDFIELDATARRNGWTLIGTCNGSTSHETARGIRIAGRYGDSHGPILADVNDAQTVTIGATTTRTDPDFLPPPTQLGHHHADGNAAMWVAETDTTGLGIAWRASNGATIHVHDPRRVDVDTLSNVDATSTITRY